jgi:thiol-disulfide isomerase/thioredoxin
MANVGRVLALLVTLTATTHADPVQPPGIDSAITTAAVSKKPLIAEFSATWCGPCRKFESDVLPLADVQQALGDVVFVHYNAEASPGDDAASRFHVSAYPTFLVIDKQGVEVKRVAGAMSSPAFIAFLAEAKVLTTDEADVRADLRAHPKDPAVHMQAARWFASRKMATDAIREYTRVIANAGGLHVSDVLRRLVEERESSRSDALLNDLRRSFEPARSPIDMFTCSFCGAHRKDVVKLISGPRVFICDTCVADATAVVSHVLRTG